MDWYILKGHEPVKVQNLLEYTRWQIDADPNDPNRVAGTIIYTPEHLDYVRISTVFLGLDHQFNDGPPLLFETMVFGGTLHHQRWRYSNWEEAKSGHDRMVAQVRGQLILEDAFSDC